MILDGLVELLKKEPPVKMSRLKFRFIVFPALRGSLAQADCRQLRSPVVGLRGNS
jgi:hypothetical protein